MVNALLSPQFLTAKVSNSLICMKERLEIVEKSLCQERRKFTFVSRLVAFVSRGTNSPSSVEARKLCNFYVFETSRRTFQQIRWIVQYLMGNFEKFRGTFELWNWIKEKRSRGTKPFIVSSSREVEEGQRRGKKSTRVKMYDCEWKKMLKERLLP